MGYRGNIWLVMLTLLTFTAVGLAGAPAAAQQKPNIVVIMGDDIGIWNIGAYHRGMMAGRTPNLDKIAIEFPPMQKGASFNLDAVKAKIEAARGAMSK